MVKAIGTPADETGHTQVGSKEYGEGLATHVKAAREALDKAEEEAKAKKKGATRKVNEEWSKVGMWVTEKEAEVWKGRSSVPVHLVKPGTVAVVLPAGAEPDALA